jgi:hypothetical protein
MQLPPLDPDVTDTAPSSVALTAYDEEHLVTYLRLLDADAEGADWHDVARIVLHLDLGIAPGERLRATGARDEFHLAAIVQNLKTTALRLLGPPTDGVCASIS